MPKATKPTKTAEHVVEDEVRTEPPAQRVKKTQTAPTTPRSLFVSLEETPEFLRVLYYGKEGSGKTAAALTAGNLGRVLLVNAEGGVKRRALNRLGIDLSQVQVWPQPGEAITYEGLQNVYLELKADLDENPKSWAAVVFDSWTEITQAFLESVAQARNTKVEAQKGITLNAIDRAFTDRNDYSIVSKWNRDLLRKFRDLQCHTIWTALERRDVDEDTGRTQYGPAVPPAVMTDLLGYVDIVLNTRAEDDEVPYFRAASKRAGKARAKDRNGALPTVLVNPSFERVLAYTEEVLTQETDPVQAVQQQTPNPSVTPASDDDSGESAD